MRLAAASTMPRPEAQASPAQADWLGCSNSCGSVDKAQEASLHELVKKRARLFLLHAGVGTACCCGKDATPHVSTGRGLSAQSPTTCRGSNWSLYSSWRLPCMGFSIITNRQERREQRTPLRSLLVGRRCLRQLRSRCSRHHPHPCKLKQSMAKRLAASVEALTQL